MTALDKYLASVKARAEKATKGPWSKTSSLPVYAVAADGVDVATATGREYRQNYPGKHGMREADAEFTAAARTDIPRLVAMVERSRQELVAVQERFHSELCEETCCGACKSLTDAMAELDRIAGEDGT